MSWESRFSNVGAEDSKLKKQQLKPYGYPNQRCYNSEQYRTITKVNDQGCFGNGAGNDSEACPEKRLFKIFINPIHMHFLGLLFDDLFVTYTNCHGTNKGALCPEL